MRKYRIIKFGDGHCKIQYKGRIFWNYVRETDGWSDWDRKFGSFHEATKWIDAKQILQISRYP